MLTVDQLKNTVESLVREAGWDAEYATQLLCEFIREKSFFQPDLLTDLNQFLRRRVADETEASANDTDEEDDFDEVDDDEDFEDDSDDEEDDDDYEDDDFDDLDYGDDDDDDDDDFDDDSDEDDDEE